MLAIGQNDAQYLPILLVWTSTKMEGLDIGAAIWKN